MQEPAQGVQRINLALIPRRQVVVPRTIVLLWAFNTGLLGLALPLYVVTIGRSTGEWGLLAGVQALLMIFAEPVWGRLSDRMVLSVPLAASEAGSAFVAPFFLLTSNMGVLLTIQAAGGLTEMGGVAAGRKALASALGTGNRALGLGIFQACLTGGIGVGSMLAGYIINLWGYVPVFVVSASFSLAGLLVTMRNRAALRSRTSRTGLGNSCPRGRLAPAPCDGHRSAG